jgi:Tol biopolymer transport system component
MKKIFFTFTVLIICSFGVFAQSSVFYQEANWAADGKSISFSLYRKAAPADKLLSYEIYVSGADGSNLQKIADNATWTSWSKDGKRLLFSRSSTDRKTSDIFSIKKDGSDLVQLTREGRRNSHPAYSPDGQKIAFTSTRDVDKNQIYLMNSDGTSVTRLTVDPAVGHFNPMWSPDGTKLVFYAEKGDQKDQVWTINIDGTNQTLLTHNLGHNTFPSFSPDGKLIVFNSKRDEQQGIYTMNSVDGSNLKPLGDLKSFYARYSPNGKKILFIVGGFPSNDLYIADAEGTHQLKITNREAK